MSLDQHTMVIQSNETGVRELLGPSVWGAGAGKELSLRPWNEGVRKPRATAAPQKLQASN
jgi:hypothetical protein